MFTDFTPKKPIIFECKKCAFISSNKKDYTRHLSTAKHKKFTEFTHFTPKNPTAFIAINVTSTTNLVWVYGNINKSV